ncbi:hypothetical protein D3C81_864020 [compost metagenome]
MHVDALNNLQVKTVAVRLPLHLFDFVHRPFFPCRHVVQRPYQAFHPGNLLDLIQRHRVIALAEPAKCHAHTFTAYLVFVKPSSLA